MIIYFLFCLIVLIDIIFWVNQLPKGNLTKEEIENESRLW